MSAAGAGDTRALTRREAILVGTKAAAFAAFGVTLARAATAAAAEPFGAVVGDRVAAKVGEDILRGGGNAVDAAVASAFAAGIGSPQNCGIGGYGGHAIVGLAGGKPIVAFDFNSPAPRAARPDMFPLDATGRVKDRSNTLGWRAVGVPGTLAGLELILRRFGTRSLRDVLAPAIELCESGRHVVAVNGIDDVGVSAAEKDAARPAALANARARNTALAQFLKTLAARNSGESFYRGDIADTIAAAFERNGGLVTAADLAAYRAREIPPVSLEWNGAMVHTVPLTSTGPLLLQALAILRTLAWPQLPERQRLHGKLEALRMAWADRLRHFGDPDHVSVPLENLLSTAHAAELAERASAAVKSRKPVPLDVTPSLAGGTTNIAAVDRHGNMIALTLTHGGGHGAKVVVPEYGLVLGHGMSRFDPRPGLPNSVGPGKRPITNMCPTLVTRAGIPVLAAGGAGGTRIPNGMFEVLANFVGLGTSLDTAIESPRLDTQGTLQLGLERRHSADDETFFREIGYTTSRTNPANISAVTFAADTRLGRGLSRGAGP